MTATTAMPGPGLPTIALPTRHAHVHATTITIPPEADCRTCGPLDTGGIYHSAAIVGRRHTQTTGHTVDVTAATATTYQTTTGVQP